MRLRTISVLLLAATLAGCVSAQERRAMNESECRSYGFEPGTDAFANCLLQLDLDRRAAIRANRIALEAAQPPILVYHPGRYRNHHHERGRHRRHH